jgi:hypothetical protein
LKEKKKKRKKEKRKEPSGSLFFLTRINRRIRKKAGEEEEEGIKGIREQERNKKAERKAKESEANHCTACHPGGH